MRQKLGLTDKNKHNVIYWCNFIREVGEQYLKAHPQQLGCFHDDGRLIVVEIDESKYFHRKYHREQWTGALSAWSHRKAQRQVLHGGSSGATL